MKTYKHIFFDLDRTLWDYEANAREAFEDIFEEFDLFMHIADIDVFIDKFHVYNEQLWNDYRKGVVTKDRLRTERFFQTLGAFGIHDNNLAGELGERYLALTPFKKHVMPGTYETLDYLLNNNYSLYVITNGFKKIQMLKMQSCGLLKYFSRIITSEDVRHQKPHREIFEYALKVNNARKEESIMIGDDWDVDILGSRGFGIDQIFYNPDRNPLTGNVEPTYEIYSLKELKGIFIS